MSKTLLLSAYACEPHKGSEPAVGWQWALESARLGHEVWVITRRNNEPFIRQALEQSPQPNLRFVFYDLPAGLRKWKRGSRGIHLYYLLWQWGAYLEAKALAKRISFDWVHHVTFVSIRQPSFMGLLGIPFIFGPVAGGESAPFSLRKGYPLKGWLRDLARDVLNLGVRFDPFMHLTFRKAQHILATSEQTRALIPRAYWPKSQVQLAIGIESPTQEKGVRPEGNRFLYVGNLLYLKGMHLGLQAFARLLEPCPEARLTMVGSGPEEGRLRALAEKLGIAHAIDWRPWMERAEVLKLYSQHHALLFPSLHDSGGMVVLEALTHGLPVVCLDLGGPGVIVDETCGKVIRTQGRSEHQVVADLAQAMAQLASDEQEWARCSDGAWQRAKQHQWRSIVASTYERLNLQPAPEKAPR